MSNGERRAWHRFWLVDPLDGTKEFINRNGEFTVNIALIEDGRPILGVVHAPVLELTYAAAQGTPARRSNHDEPFVPIRSRASVGDPLRVVASRSHAGPETTRFLDALRARHTVEVVSRGSSLKICQVAEGSADVYPRLGPTMEWDTAAAHVVGLDGSSLRYNKTDLRNPHFLVSATDPGPYLEWMDLP